jgi:hypothetical protein
MNNWQNPRELKAIVKNLIAENLAMQFFLPCHVAPPSPIVK